MTTVSVTGSPADTQHPGLHKSLEGLGFLVGVIVIHGVLMQGSVEIRGPYEELALWEMWESGLDPPFAIKRKKSASHM